MLKQRPQPQTQTSTTLKTRGRPSNGFLNTISLSTPQVYDHIRRIEETPLFLALKTMGVIRSNSPIHIPAYRYLDYMDQHIVEFAQHYHPERRDTQWIQDFISCTDLHHVERIVQKYQTPVEDTWRIVRYLKITSRDNIRLRTTPADINRLGIQSSLTLSDDTVNRIASFVEKYNINQVQFVSLFINGNHDSGFIATKTNSSQSEVEDILQQLDILQITDSMASMSISNQITMDESPERVICNIYNSNSGDSFEVEFTSVVKALILYEVDESALSRLDKNLHTSEAFALLSTIKALNQTGSVLQRLTNNVIAHQHQFLLTNNTIDLMPLTQTEVASAIGVSRSTVSRALKNSVISTPKGNITLKSLCPPISFIIKELDKTFPGLSTQAMTKILIDRYHIALAHRTIMHHRQKKANNI